MTFRICQVSFRAPALRLAASLAIVTGSVVALVPAIVNGVPAAPRARVTSLGVAGRANATPWVAADGALVAVAWGASGGGQSDVFVAVSRNDGETFDAPVRANREQGEARLGGELPPRVAIVPRPPGGAGTGEQPSRDILVLWTARGPSTALKLARSRDGGRTFEAPLTLQSPGARGDRGWPALAADAHGTAHVVWLDHRGLAAEHAGTGPHGRTPHDGVAMAQRSGLYYAAVGASESGTSPAHGKTAVGHGLDAGTGEREITSGVCYCCKTAVAVRPDATLFTAWRQVYPRDVRDIAFSVSRDAGRSFSPPARVSADDWTIDGCPDDGPAIAVDLTGTAHVVWPTVIGDRRPEGAIFHASTTDGRTFTRRVRIATLGGGKPAHPQVAVAGDRGLFVAWDEIVNGTRQAAVRPLTRGPSADFVPGPIVMLSEGGPASYPVMAPARGRVIAVWTSGAPGTSVIGLRRLAFPAARP